MNRNTSDNKQNKQDNVGTDNGAHLLDRYSVQPKQGDTQNSEKNPYYQPQVPTIQLPKGGGAIKGIDEKFNVNAVNGTTSLEVSLPLSPGRNGFTPSLSLQYNSGGGNSEFGLGWGLNIPSIQRKTDKKLPEYDDANHSDVFILAGAEDLVPVTNSSGEVLIGKYDTNCEDVTSSGLAIRFLVTTYTPRIEGLYARIERIKDETTNRAFWRVSTKDNIITYYGLSTDSCVANPTDETMVFKWLPELVIDNKGNFQYYTYVAEDYDEVPADAHERNRGDDNISGNKYLKSVQYCNKTPYTIDADKIYKPTLPTVTDNCLMQVVLDYGDHDDYKPATGGNSIWPCRKDAFSDFHAGFEIRTYRLCRRVMMFHYFKELNDDVDMAPTIVRSLDIEYEHDGETGYVEADYITSITQNGYKYNGSGYHKRALPPMTFTHNPLDWNTDIERVSPEDVANAPQGLTGPYQWIDLWGEGLPGILSEQGAGWFYKNNSGDGHFTPAQQIAEKPSLQGLGSSLQWQDLDGDGRRQVVNRDKSLSGYYELDDDQKWQSFKSFKENPNVDWNSPYTKLLDLDGDGRADLLMTDDMVWTWYKNKGKEGYTTGGRNHTEQDEELGPRLLLNDQVQSVFLADMNGDGLTDLVRIKNGEICYWPNMGYGKFGMKVTMTNAPVFDNLGDYNPEHLTLADISGTGAPDIIYLGNNKCTAWINLSGNAWSEAYDINPLPSVEQYSKIAVLDFLGNGTGCIVWSSPLPQHAHAPMRYIDLMGGDKPYLMKTYSNGMGKTVEVNYKSSTKYYLEDKLNRTPWATRLPFPVHCVDKIITSDSISDTSYTQEYSYHHGYYDHEEREFRGFGRVDVKDIDTAKIDISNDFDQSPVLTKSWYHTGAWLIEGTLLEAFEEEYYDGGTYLSNAPAHIKLPDEGLTAIEYREAYRALKGLPLRQEVYALDETDKQDHPYTVTAYAYCTELVQHMHNNRYASYRSYQQQSVVWHYERESGDPRVLHELTLETDDYGNILQSAQVAYPRTITTGLPAIVAGEQDKMLVTYTKNDFTNDVDDNHHYRLRVPCETKTYELHDLDTPTGLWLPADLLSDIAGATEIDYAKAPSGNEEKRLLSHTRILYKENDADTVAALGTVESLAIQHEQYQLAFTYYEHDAGPPAVYKLRSVEYDALVDDDMLHEGGYLRNKKTAPWDTTTPMPGFPDSTSNPEEEHNIWLPSGTVDYGTTPASSFYTPEKYIDPWGNETTVTYYDDGTDNYYLLPETVTDDKGNVTTVNDYDWRCLQPTTVTDPNDNISEILYDTLCMPVAMALKGKGTEADYLTYDNGTSIVPLDPEDSTDLATQTDFWRDPKLEAADLLRRATWRCIYDLNSSDGTDPVRVAMIAREEHWEDNNDSPLKIRITYTDGLGRVAMHKAQATNDPVSDDERWIASGKTVYNNKGNAVMQYEPFFDEDADYDTAAQAAAQGVTPLMHYDPLGRVYRTDLPDGSFTLTQWTAWEQVVYDNNDTLHFDLDNDSVYDSQWRVDREAGGSLAADTNEVNTKVKAVIHANTPTTMHLDTLARPFYTIQVNAWDDNGVQTEDLESYVVLDILGNRLEVHDARGKTPLTYQYSQLKAVVSQLSIDSGQQYMLSAADGQPLYAWDTDDREFHFEYDELRRPTLKEVNDGADKTLEVIEYGEGATNDKTHNLRGQLHLHKDGAGTVQVDDYDFKGNPLNSVRTFTEDYDVSPDWSGTVTLETATYETATTYDALNRPVTITTPDDGATNYTYDEGGQLFTVRVEDVHSNTSTGLTSTLVKGVFYNAKGQRTKIQQSKGDGTITQITTTTYEYDPNTFRVTRIRTVRTSDNVVLQDLNYYYDPVGNITYMRDDSWVFTDNDPDPDTHRQEAYFGSNEIIHPPHHDYTYDALYRIIKAGGREHGSGSAALSYDDGVRMGKAHPNDASSIRLYEQYYTYDEVGNMAQMKHTTTGGTGNWTRDFITDTATNRLDETELGGTSEATYTYDNRGNLTDGFAHLVDMEYNAENRLEKVEKTADITVYYQYDGNGQRVRKVVVDETAPTNHVIQMRKYIGSWEYYKKYDNSTTSAEIETLHVMDDSARIVQIDTDLLATTVKPVARYQFSDHLGTAAVEVDESANVLSYEEYYPFGSTSFQCGNSSNISMKRYRFTDKERDDETGLYYHGARYYAPWLARWCASDPLQSEMPTWSSYNYGFCNPITWQDSTGMQPDGAPDKFTDSHGNNYTWSEEFGSYALDELEVKPESDVFSWEGNLEGGRWLDIRGAKYRFEYSDDGFSDPMNYVKFVDNVGLSVWNAGVDVVDALVNPITTLNDIGDYFSDLWDYTTTTPASQQMEDLKTDAVNFATDIRTYEDIGGALLTKKLAGSKKAPNTKNISLENSTFSPIKPGPLSPEIANTFRSATYTERVASEPITLYRSYGGNAKELSAYWTRTKPTGPTQAIIDMALDRTWGNTATKTSSITIPKGTVFYEGAAARQGNLLGGGNQIYIPIVKSQWLNK